MIRRLIVAIAVTVAAVAVSAGAHEGHSHGKAHKMMGTVKAVHADMSHVELTTKDGTSGFYVNAKTRYLKGKESLALGDLKPGMRVVVEGRMEGAKMTATQVRLAGAVKADAAPAAHKH